MKLHRRNTGRTACLFSAPKNVAKRKGGIKRQMLIASGSVCIVILAMLVYLYIQLSGTMQKKVQEYAQSSMDQIEEIVSSMLETVKDVSTILSFNTTLQQFLLEEGQGTTARLAQKEILSEAVKDYAGINPSIADILLVDSRLNFTSFMGNTDFLIFKNLLDKYDLGNIHLKQSRFISIRVYAKDASTFYYGYLSPVFDFTATSGGAHDRIGTVIVLCENTRINGVLKNSKIMEGTAFYIVDANSTVVSSNMNDYIGRNSREVYNRVRYLKDSMLLEKNIRNAEWKILNEIRFYTVVSDLQGYQRFVIVTAFVLVFLIILLMNLINYSITRPIGKIVRSLQHIGVSNIKERIAIPAYNEVGFISENINLMLDKIEDMTNRIVLEQQMLYETELSKKRSELSALQSQINPHFLYNTLECVRSIGVARRINEIKEIASAMATIFRYSIKEQPYVHVERELEIIGEYIKIMNIRFWDKFEVRYDISRQTRDKMIMKMLLQPIVENAFYHGLEPKEGKGRLDIFGRVQGDTLVFEITDNGIGMDPLKLQNITSVLDSPGAGIEGRHIGMMNINKRIKLEYGERYGISISSLKDQGTKVTIRLPVKNDLEGVYSQ